MTPNDRKGETATAQSSFQDQSLYITPLTTQRPSASYEGPQGARGTIEFAPQLKEPEFDFQSLSTLKRKGGGKGELGLHL